MMDGAITDIIFVTGEFKLIPHRVDIRHGRLTRLVFFGIDEGHGMEALAPTMRTIHEFHRSGFLGNLVKRQPKRANLLAPNWPIGQIVMPDGRLIRPWLLNQKLAEDDIDFL